MQREIFINSKTVEPISGVVGVVAAAVGERAGPLDEVENVEPRGEVCDDC